MRLKTITTIEVSSKCNLACSYCINRLMDQAHRVPMVMADSVFARTLYWLERLCAAGTQREINMNGNGEPLLDPQLVRRIRRVREVVGPRKVQFSTNGVAMTAELAEALKTSGVDEVHVSTHKPEIARRAGAYLVRAGVPGCYTYGPTGGPHNWAGQLEDDNATDAVFLPKGKRCDPLVEGRGYVQAEGQVTPCCHDYRNLGAFGTVFDDDLDQRDIKPFSLCRTCHQIIPPDIAARYGVTQNVIQN